MKKHKRTGLLIGAVSLIVTILISQFNTYGANALEGTLTANKTITVTTPGYYEFDLYGAKGGDYSSYSGGNGGRTHFKINLKAGDTVELKVDVGGGTGSITNGGGATALYVNGILHSVAGGGGGATKGANGGAGGADDSGNTSISLAGESSVAIGHSHTGSSTTGSGCYTTAIKHQHIGDSTNGGGCYTEEVAHQHTNECYGDPIQHVHTGDSTNGGGCYITPVYHSHVSSCYSRQYHQQQSGFIPDHSYAYTDDNGTDWYYFTCWVTGNRYLGQGLWGASHYCNVATCGKTEQTIESYELGCNKDSSTIDSYELSCTKGGVAESYELGCGKTENDIDHYELNCSLIKPNSAGGGAGYQGGTSGHYHAHSGSTSTKGDCYTIPVYHVHKNDEYGLGNGTKKRVGTVRVNTNDPSVYTPATTTLGTRGCYTYERCTGSVYSTGSLGKTNPPYYDHSAKCQNGCDYDRPYTWAAWTSSYSSGAYMGQCACVYQRRVCGKTTSSVDSYNLSCTETVENIQAKGGSNYLSSSCSEYHYLDTTTSYAGVNTGAAKAICKYIGEQVKVTLDATGGTVDGDSVITRYTTQAYELPGADRENYDFLGWYTAETGGTKVESTDIVTNNKNHTLYAHWLGLDSVITFIPNLDLPHQSASYNVGETLSTVISRIEFTGYTIDSCYLTEADMIAGTNKLANNYKLPNPDMMIYCKLVGRSITCSLDGNGYSQAISPITVIYGKTYSNLPETLARTDYVFEGWYTAKTGGSRVTNEDIVTKTENHTLYAQWREKTSAIEYDYTGKVQKFTAPESGFYRIEAWGAQGGNYGSYSGGKGGYVQGTKYMKQGETIYIYVGGQAKLFNGAGQGTHATNAASKGGGATDIRTSGIEGSTDWQSTLSTRFLVAGGGGGATDTISGMTGGGAGGDGGADGSGGSGTLGQGQSTAEVLGAGGGGGYYGGEAGYRVYIPDEYRTCTVTSKSWNGWRPKGTDYSPGDGYVNNGMDYSGCDRLCPDSSGTARSFRSGKEYIHSACGSHGYWGKWGPCIWEGKHTKEGWSDYQHYGSYKTYKSSHQYLYKKAYYLLKSSTGGSNYINSDLVDLEKQSAGVKSGNGKVVITPLHTVEFVLNKPTTENADVNATNTPYFDSTSGFYRTVEGTSRYVLIVEKGTKYNATDSLKVNTGAADIVDFPYPYLKGWKFTGWYTEPNYKTVNGTKVHSGTKRVTTDTFNSNNESLLYTEVLYAHWEEDVYYIKYYKNDTTQNVYGDESTTSPAYDSTLNANIVSSVDHLNDWYIQKVQYDHNITVSNSLYFKQGYYFQYWTNNSDTTTKGTKAKGTGTGKCLGTKYYESDVITPVANGENFIADKGNFNYITNPRQVYYGTATPVWNYLTNGTGTNSDTVVLYAIWEPITYQLRFNGNENWNTTQGSYLQNVTGASSAATTKIRYDQYFTLAANKFTRNAPYNIKSPEGLDVVLNKSYSHVGWGFGLNNRKYDTSNVWKLLETNIKPNPEQGLLDRDYTETQSNVRNVLSTDAISALNKYVKDWQNNQTSSTISDKTFWVNNSCIQNLWSIWRVQDTPPPDVPDDPSFGITLTFDLNGGYLNVKNKFNYGPIVLKQELFNDYYYEFDIIGNVNKDHLNHTAIIDAYGAYSNTSTPNKNYDSKTGVNKVYHTGDGLGGVYRLSGWSINKGAIYPDYAVTIDGIKNNNFDTFDAANNNNTIKICNDTTLYAVWEPVLQMNVELTNTVTGNKVKTGTLTDATQENMQRNGLPTLAVKPGQEIKYLIALRGENKATVGSRIEPMNLTVEFDSMMTGIYNSANKDLHDGLNQIAADDLDDPNEKMLLSTTNLNRKFVKQPNKSIIRKFSIPVYLGTERAEEVGYPSFKADGYTLNITASRPSNFHKGDEVVTAKLILDTTGSINSSNGSGGSGGSGGNSGGGGTGSNLPSSTVGEFRTNIR